MSDREKKTRVQFDFGPTAIARLDALKDKMETASYAEVLRNALKIYDWLVNEAGEEARVVVRKPDGTTELVKVFQ